ncbi:hypothetical protein HZC53_04735 [Candidatus Uhrbacteria bacterium]|nr:hypothetical protein [Candidatus Uhrbacteria bacterium]
MSSAKIECLSVAVSAIAACLKDGRVTNDALAPIAAAISLGIAPPFVRPGSKPFAVEGVLHAPGSWPHFARALCNIEAQQMDLGKLRELAKAGDQAAERRGNFVNMVLTSIHGAFVSAHKRCVQIEQDEARREREAKERIETEAQRQAREARRAARNALEAAALGNAEAPAEVAKPQQSRRRTPEGVTALIASESRKRVGDEDSEAEAKLAACRFVFRLVHDDAKSGSYSATEIVSLKDAIKAEVTNTYFKASGRLTEAEREAAAWMQRGEEVMAAKDRASAPKPQTPKPEAAKPKPAAQKPAPKKAEKPAKEPAKPLLALSVDATTQPETAMGLALQKALGGGKAANG